MDICLAWHFTCEAHHYLPPVLRAEKNTQGQEKNNKGMNQIPKGRTEIAKGRKEIAKGRKEIGTKLKAQKKY